MSMLLDIGLNHVFQVLTKDHCSGQPPAGGDYPDDRGGSGDGDH